MSVIEDTCVHTPAARRTITSSLASR